MRQSRCDIGIDHQADLRGRYGKNGRSHFPQDPAHAGVAQADHGVNRDVRQHADLRQRRDLQRDLGNAADHHRNRHRVDRLLQ